MWKNDPVWLNELSSWTLDAQMFPREAQTLLDVGSDSFSL